MSEKLIRDRIPSIPHPQFASMHIRKVQNRMEHILFLQKKEREEYDEFLWAKTQDERSSEAADYLEVLDTLIYLLEQNKSFFLREWVIHKREEFLCRLLEDGLNEDFIIQLQKAKREDKWWFLEGIIWLKD